MTEPPPYPTHWEADVVLRDGATVHLRPITPDDAESLVRFHERQSPESTYLRFFAPMPRLSARDVRRFTTVDHVGRVAIVVTLGEDIVGVGRYERTGPAVAEVAFNISDAHQGRGIGSVLLEHLAAAARENGLRGFVAEVLPLNRKMLQVFRDAGYEVRQAYDDGVVSLHFDIDPTERSLAVMEAREHRAEARSVERLLNPSSVAMIGGGRTPGTIGHRLLADLLAGGFTGRVAVVHPHADVVQGVPAVRSVRDVPPPVDLALVAVPAERVLGIVRECAAVGVHGLLVVSSGFAETGAEGLARQRELVRLARANGMRVVGPKSWGMINAHPGIRLNVSLAEQLPVPGRLALFSQSGGLSVAVLDAAGRRGLGVSTFVSAGNRADVSGNDCMQYWETDPHTDVIAMYMESVGNPRKWTRIARRVSRTKPVIVVKSGMSSFGVPPGHAVRASSAPREVLHSMFTQAGVIRAETVPQLLDIAQLMVHQPLPAGPRVGIVGNSDALGALIADACVSWELEVTHGPVSLHPQAGPEEYRAALGAAFADPGVDAVVAAFIPPIATQADEVARVLAQVSSASSIPVVACFLGISGGVGEALAERRTVPSCPTPEEAVRALAAATRYAAWRRRDPGHRPEPGGMSLAAARELVDAALGEVHRPAGPDVAVPGTVALEPAAAAALLATVGVEVWPAVPVADADEASAAAARLGYPVALKATAEHLRHRVDLGGVRLDIAGEVELRDDFAQLRERLGHDADACFVVQKMAPSGVACMLRSLEDPLFGPVVSFGLSGDASDLLGDVAHRIPPLTDVDVADLIRSVRAAPKLFGHAGAAPVDVTALEDLVCRMAALADELPEIAELELNPVVVAEAGLAVLDAQIRLAPTPGRTDTGRRGLTTG